MNDQLHRFFAEYGANFDNPEANRLAYGEASVTSTPEGVFSLRGDAEYKEALGKVSKYQIDSGMQSLRPVEIDAKDLDDIHTLAKVKWDARFKKTGSRPVEFDITYLLRRDGDKYQILAYEAHQSEIAMRRELGLDQPAA